MSKAPLCPKGLATRNGKHAWTFVRNAGKSTISHGPNGGIGRFSVVALYECECGATRTGPAKTNAPGADLRDHFKMGPDA